MGTKNQPSKHDCYANAEPDEPMFVLLGRDRHAPGLVQAWAGLRRLEGEPAEVITEALQCATAMARWRAVKQGLPEPVSLEQVGEVLLGIQEIALTGGRLGRRRKGDWMQTYTGRQFWPLDPRADEVFIEDIAHHLALITRYNGACKVFYSVAQHSVLVSDSLPTAPQGVVNLALEGLLHDAAEAYAGDMIRPLKRHLPEYKAAIARIERVIAEHFGLASEMPVEVKEADNRALVTEQRDIMAKPPVPWEDQGVEPFGDLIEYWPPALAEATFLQRFHQIRAMQR